MLVLSRTRGEEIVISHGSIRITIKVVDIRDQGRKVRIGIDAPRDYEVHRAEIQERIDAQEERRM